MAVYVVPELPGSPSSGDLYIVAPGVPAQRLLGHVLANGYPGHQIYAGSSLIWPPVEIPGRFVISGNPYSWSDDEGVSWTTRPGNIGQNLTYHDGWWRTRNQASPDGIVFNPTPTEPTSITWIYAGNGIFMGAYSFAISVGERDEPWVAQSSPANRGVIWTGSRWFRYNNSNMWESFDNGSTWQALPGNSGLAEPNQRHFFLGGVHVAVASHSTNSWLSTSVNGTSFGVISGLGNPGSSSSIGAAWGNGAMVVTKNETVLWSNDGFTWHAPTLPPVTTGTIGGVDFGQNYFVLSRGNKVFRATHPDEWYEIADGIPSGVVAYGIPSAPSQPGGGFRHAARGLLSA